MCNFKVGDRIVCNGNPSYNGKYGTIIGKQSRCYKSGAGDCYAIVSVKFDNGQKDYIYSYMLGLEGSTQQAPAAPDFSPFKIGDIVTLNAEGRKASLDQILLKLSDGAKITGVVKLNTKDIEKAYTYSIEGLNSRINGCWLKLLHTNKSRVECTCKSLLYGCVCGAGRAEMTATNSATDPMVEFFKSSTKEWKSKHG